MSTLGQPYLTVINESFGSQSFCMLAMVILGELPRPPNLVVINADPGMEDHRTYALRHFAEREMADAGIWFETVPGPNLYRDLVTLKRRKATRIDNPPYWVRKPDGTVGQLSQKCTREYKIRPMDRTVRRLLKERWGISPKSPNIGAGMVEKWIGFAADEEHRNKEPDQAYQRFRFPLQELGMTRADVSQWYHDHDIEEPPRSVCVGCFGHGLETLKDMHDNRPEDWRAAVACDEAARSLPGVDHPAYVSRTCIPLTELAERGFVVDAKDLGGDPADYICDEGVCFV